MPDDGRIPITRLELRPRGPDRRRIEGVVIAELVDLREGQALVRHPELDEGLIQPAGSTRALGPEDIGCELALIFVDGDPARPMILGKLEHPRPPARETRRELLLEAEREITLRCGRSSITLTREGKIVIRGKELLSRASALNRIRGGVIQLN